jgi:hypothetical protein
MTLRTAALVLLISSLATLPAAASDDPKTFACSFVVGVTHSYEKGAFVAEKAAALSFGIATINAEAQTAEIKTQRGTGPLHVVRAVNALHFIEVVTEGFLNLTTVYDKDDAKGTYPAVHSRHFGVLGQPLVTQYQGFCEAKE